MVQIIVDGLLGGAHPVEVPLGHLVDLDQLAEEVFLFLRKEGLSANGAAPLTFSSVSHELTSSKPRFSIFS